MCRWMELAKTTVAEMKCTHHPFNVWEILVISAKDKMSLSVPHKLRVYAQLTHGVAEEEEEDNEQKRQGRKVKPIWTPNTESSMELNRLQENQHGINMAWKNSPKEGQPR